MAERRAGQRRGQRRRGTDGLQVWDVQELLGADQQVRVYSDGEQWPLVSCKWWYGLRTHLCGAGGLTEEEPPPVFSQEEVARIWQAAMTDWLADRQKGYRKNTEA